MSDPLIGSRRYVDFSGFTVPLHFRGDVYTITPNIIGKFPESNHPCHQGACMYSYPDLKDRQVLYFTRQPEFLNKVLHIERSLHCLYGIIGISLRKSTSTHIGITNGFYFLQIVLFNNIVESTENLIKLIQ